MTKLTEKIVYNEETKAWEKLVFPSEKPNRRIEIYLLAKMMDEMLAKLKELDKPTQKFFLILMVVNCVVIMNFLN